MIATFADTFFYLALLHEDDEAHIAAVTLSERLRSRIVTTAWVLTELADALCSLPHRRAVCEFISLLRTDPNTEIIAPAEALFTRGLEMYSKRPDKEWSLTDCISFVVMTERGLTEALTGDHHFQQAGFQALLATR